MRLPQLPELQLQRRQPARPRVQQQVHLQAQRQQDQLLPVEQPVEPVAELAAEALPQVHLQMPDESQTTLAVAKKAVTNVKIQTKA